MTDLDEFMAQNPPGRRGFQGVMDRISAEDREKVIDGWRRGYSGPRLREFLQLEYPEIRFTPANVDGWLSKNHPRFTRG